MTQNDEKTYNNFSSAGPPFKTSLTAIAGSPVTKSDEEMAFD